VTPSGDIVIANTESHPDLFWALRGGGASTFGVLTKVTYKAYPRPSIMPCTLTFYPTLLNDTRDFDSYYKAMAWYYTIAPNFTDFGIGGYPVASKYGYTGPFVVTNKTYTEITGFLDPIADHMKNNWNVSFSYILLPEVVMDNVLWPSGGPNPFQEPAGRFWVPMVSRIFSREAMTSNRTAELYNFIKKTMDDGATHMAYPNMPGIAKRNRNWDFSLNTAWRDASQHVMVTNWSWNTMQDIRNLYDRMLRRYIPLMDKFSDNHAAYMNEVSERFCL
jgi:hypothetical protein